MMDADASYVCANASAREKYQFKLEHVKFFTLLIFLSEQRLGIHIASGSNLTNDSLWVRVVRVSADARRYHR
jgi:hypothetical protein